jgi:hypothetical protein
MLVSKICLCTHFTLLPASGKCAGDPTHIRFVVRGRDLPDHYTVSQCELMSGATIYHESNGRKPYAPVDYAKLADRLAGENAIRYII